MLTAYDAKGKIFKVYSFLYFIQRLLEAEYKLAGYNIPPAGAFTLSAASSGGRIFEGEERKLEGRAAKLTQIKFPYPTSKETKFKQTALYDVKIVAEFQCNL